MHPQQLPRTFISGLASRPWHSLVAGEPGSYPHLRPVSDLLESSANELAAEFKRLKARGLLYPETECINDAETTPGGAWRTYSVNAAWVDRNATTDCSFDTPVACALLESVRGAMAHASPSFHVLRAGYSALAPGAHLEPHCGMTNGQLKFHLGLVVPMVGKGDERRPCAGELPKEIVRRWGARKLQAPPLLQKSESATRLAPGAREKSSSSTTAGSMRCGTGAAPSESSSSSSWRTPTSRPRLWRSPTARETRSGHARRSSARFSGSLRRTEATEALFEAAYRA